MAESDPSPRRPVRRPQDLPAPEQRIDVVVFGASAGGLEALARVLGSLPPRFGAAVFVVLHIAPTGTSALARILDRASPLPVSEASDGARIEAGHVYVAPPNRHLELERGAMRARSGPRENGHRPAIDPLFRSAARAYGPHVAGVILSGALDDGTAGLRDIHEHGGIALVQDPDTALYPGMPRSAAAHVDVDAVLNVEQIPAALMRLADRAAAPAAGTARATVATREPEEPRASRFGCPECGGPLWEVKEGDMSRFRCAVGHAYSQESLFNSEAQQLEAALWAAVRLLEDRAVLLRRMGATVGKGRRARSFELRADEAAERARLIRATLGQGAAAPRVIEDVGDVAP